MGHEAKSPAQIDVPHILVAHNLTPSDTAQLNRKLVLGFATDVGSRTSHTAIMARSLNIPAVVALRNVSEGLLTGDHVLLDGYSGLVIINPSDQTLWEYGELEVKKSAVDVKLDELRETISTTLDGRHIALSANIELPSDVELVKQSGAEGIGLYRTEFFYLNKEELPNEEEQYENYCIVAREMGNQSVIIRTLDLGGDKFMSALQLPAELNPFLGWRAIRFCLAQPEFFKVQLRAILRASTLKNIKIMYPMISNVKEVIEANRLLTEAKNELAARGEEFDQDIEVGVMIEIPSAALTADLIAPHVRFFSIGTNDLVQYTLAVDRVNELVSSLYEPTHPAIIKLIKHTVDVGHEHGLWTGVCGEMAGNPLLVPLLVGLGVDELSVNAPGVPLVKDVIRSLRFAQAEELGQAALRSGSAEEVLENCRQLVGKIAPEILELVE